MSPLSGFPATEGWGAMWNVQHWNNQTHLWKTFLIKKKDKVEREREREPMFDIPNGMRQSKWNPNIVLVIFLVH
jgi:hypothetical protein